MAVDDRSDERTEARAAAGGEPSSGGDLEFDEAWRERRGADDAAAGAPQTDEAPRYEDPNDR